MHSYYTGEGKKSPLDSSPVQTLALTWAQSKSKSVDLLGPPPTPLCTQSLTHPVSSICRCRQTPITGRAGLLKHFNMGVLAKVHILTLHPMRGLPEDPAAPWPAGVPSSVGHMFNTLTYLCLGSASPVSSCFCCPPDSNIFDDSSACSSLLLPDGYPSPQDGYQPETLGCAIPKRACHTSQAINLAQELARSPTHPTSTRRTTGNSLTRRRLVQFQQVLQGPDRETGYKYREAGLQKWNEA